MAEAATQPHLALVEAHAVVARLAARPVVTSVQLLMVATLLAHQIAAALAATDDVLGEGTTTPRGWDVVNGDLRKHVRAEPAVPKLCPGNNAPSRPFLVLSTQRSGSTWLIESLAQLPCVQAAHEVFSISGLPAYFWRLNLNGIDPLTSERVTQDAPPVVAMLQRKAMLTFFLGMGMPPKRCAEAPRAVGNSTAIASIPIRFRQSALYHRCSAANGQRRAAKALAKQRGRVNNTTCPGSPRALGFKYMYNQGFVRTLKAENYTGARFLAAIGTRIVHLYRRDMIAATVSALAMANAREQKIDGWTHAARTTDRADLLAKVRISPQPSHFVQTLHWRRDSLVQARAALADMRRFGLEYIEVAYEDLTEDPVLRCSVMMYVTHGSGSGGGTCGPVNAYAANNNVTLKIHTKKPSSYGASGWRDRVGGTAPPC